MRQQLPHPRPGGGAGIGVRQLAVVVVLSAFLLPGVADIEWSAPVTDEAPEAMCHCGCGNPEGRCCCTARSASRLGMTCSERDDSPIDIDSSGTGKFIGPMAKAVISGILPAHERLTDIEPAHTELDPAPEVPPPRT